MLVSLIAAGAVRSASPVLAVLYLIGVFAGVSRNLLLSGLGLLGLAYLILYVGAIAILFLFVVMLIDARKSVGGVRQLRAAATSPGLVALVLLVATLPPAQIWYSPWSLFREYLRSLNGSSDSVESMALLLYSDGLLQLLLIGVVLLVAMVGPISLNKNQNLSAGLYPRE